MAEHLLNATTVSLYQFTTKKTKEQGSMLVIRHTLDNELPLKATGIPQPPITQEKFTHSNTSTAKQNNITLKQINSHTQTRNNTATITTSTPQKRNSTQQKHTHELVITTETPP
ncbi:hypothetical protein [Pseudomonas sp. P9_31]|uniref:hypothetical protein n=1 Tax=Pseudomonas sp. P9_31 TaxID=3043448 RepID=UPI002A36F890|nr:hypothetical protein [Pseudomonas sp. P9_31]WPN59213.1 hypothetical protein QMK51_06285 [Pseudomonas sp. P9_31]